MPVQTSIQPEDNFIYSRYLGQVTLAQIRNSMIQTYTSCTYRPGMVEIDDLREISKLDLRFAGVLHITRSLVRHHKAQGTQPKVALIRGSDMTYGVARMFQNLMTAEMPEAEIDIVRSEEDAQATLGLRKGALGGLTQAAKAHRRSAHR
ncbi:hypothetical protein TRP8649_01971 [Pelagimonas phthalicica]|uniref:Uncharacterized protein n=2 Tax=Pelagimonas phthalicica TaxID=1037362 RepID=A0A238JAX6_9RHOB|nr:hypothetical protein CLV87_0102 [Pelagimonas phthalicica]SMX27861.1 hypothetical protein TRP8649_01971 [Pelagimonas phthalicica]